MPAHFTSRRSIAKHLQTLGVAARMGGPRHALRETFRYVLSRIGGATTDDLNPAHSRLALLEARERAVLGRIAELSGEAAHGSERLGNLSQSTEALERGIEVLASRIEALTADRDEARNQIRLL